MPRSLALVAVLAGIPPGAGPAGAQEQGTVLDRYGVEHWDQRVGLGGNSVRDIVQDRRGFIWVATSRGLSRFDGRTFLNLTPADTPSLPDSAPTSLARGVDGQVWVGFEGRGVRALVEDELERRPELARLAETTVNDLLVDRDGELWVSTTEGLWRASPEGGRRVAGSIPADGERPLTVQGLARSEDGAIWARTGEGEVVWRVRGDRVAQSFTMPACWGPEIAIDSGGAIVVACPSELRTLDPVSGRVEELAPRVELEGLFVDREGTTWFGTRAGLVRRTGERHETLDPSRGLSDWRLRAAWEDDTGGLWFGSYQGGLARLRRGAVSTVRGGPALPIGSTTGVLGLADGSLLVGTYNRGAVRWHPEQGVLDRWTEAQGLPSDRVWTFALDPDRRERIWMGTARGLVAVEGAEVWRHPPLGLPYDDAVYLLFSEPGRGGPLWVAGWEGGLVELRGGERIDHGAGNGLDLDRVRFLHREPAGALLAGGAGGVFRFEEPTWRRVEVGGFDRVEVRAALGGESGTLWMASPDLGLVRLAGGRLDVYGRREGLPAGGIQSLFGDSRGAIWLASSEDLMRFSPHDFEAWASGGDDRIPFETLHARDGFLEQGVNGWGYPNVTSLDAGTLVYPTTRGVALVRPADLPELRLDPDEVLVDAGWSGTRSLPREGPWRLGRNERALRIHYTAVELLRPEAVSFRHRLEGVDDDWVPGNETREAGYSPLPPGAFRFRLQARLPGHDWVEASSDVAIEVEPHLVEMPVFRFGVPGLIAIALLGFVLWRDRVRRLYTAELEQQRSRLIESRAEARELSLRLVRAQEDERRRLGRELHDDLTQRLAGLAMLAGSLSRGLRREGSTTVGSELEEMQSELEHLARDSQRVSHELHPALLEGGDLATAIQSECKAFQERTGMTVRFEARTPAAGLTPEVELALYRIVQEALRNSQRHSGAAEVVVVLEAGEGTLRLGIGDEGVGFGPAAPGRRSGIGLVSMAERARLAGGELEVDSAPGKGTRISVEIPWIQCRGEGISPTAPGPNA